MRNWIAIIAVFVTVTITVTSAQCGVETEKVTCRAGFWPVGSKCYKLVREPVDWQSAALYCGSHGASLARYDTLADKPLKIFLKMMQKFLAQAETEECVDTDTKCVEKAQSGECQAKPHWMIPNCRKSCGMCKSSTPLVPWVAGNTKVIPFGLRKGNVSLQIDVSLRAESKNERGCFQARITPCGMLIVEPNPDCDLKKQFVCGYDNLAGYNYESCVNQNAKCEEWAAAGECKTNPSFMIPTCRLACDACLRDAKPDYHPMDFVVINEPLTYPEAVVQCNALNRSVASIMNVEQQNYIAQLVKNVATDAWISVQYRVAKQAFLWAGNYMLTYSNWLEGVPREIKGFSAVHCVAVRPRFDGQWDTFQCTKKLPAVCGPKGTPMKFTHYYPAIGFHSVHTLKEKLRRLNQQDNVCDEPEVIECSAKSKDGSGWVTNNNQISSTITCTHNNFQCEGDKELDCSTFRVRFLCPREADQCQELAKIDVNPCGGGQKCYPAPNHFICRCPPGSMYSEYLKKCTDFCGECYAWGDPHYKSLSNVHFNFMGMCRFKFNGVCNKNKFGDKPNYDVYTTNVQCINGWRRDASCLSAVEVHLRNIPVTLPCGAQSKQTMVFKVKVRESHYQLDGQNVTTQIVDKPGVYKAVIRPRYFSLVVHAVGLTVLLNNGHLRVRAPDQFKGEMCGLCGDCGTEDYVMRNGSTVSVPKLNEKNYIEEEINPVGLSWMELTPEFKDMQCGLSPLKDNCTSAAKRRLHGADLCGVFGQKNGSIADCFNIAKLDRRQFWIDCIFDLCELEDPTQAVCEEVAAFAQQCIARGVPVDWRTPEFCPMTCPADMVYRVDASGQKTCGQRAGAMATLNEEPAEGCVCRDGLYRLGDKCVPPCMCPTEQ